MEGFSNLEPFGRRKVYGCYCPERSDRLKVRRDQKVESIEFKTKQFGNVKKTNDGKRIIKKTLKT